MVGGMKRIATVVCCVGVVLIGATAAQAFIGVNWLSTGMMDQNSALVDNTLMQLIWSADANMDPVAPAPGTLGPSPDPVNDDLLLASMFTGSSGGEAGYADGMGGFFGVTYNYTDLAGNGGGTLVSDAEFLAGNVYVRVFSANAPSGGDWYYQGGLAGSFVDSPTFPNQYSSSTISQSTMDMQLVPEPGTMALFGLGLVTVALRRKMKK